MAGHNGDIRDDETTAGRCPWADSSDSMRAYHDEEWGVPSHEDRHHFEMLILEGAQAGLSWSTILRKRAHYRKVFDGFDPKRVARYSDDRIAKLLGDPGIVRNRLKVVGSVTNAKAFLTTATEYGSFDAYLWSWVDGRQVVNHPQSLGDLAATSYLSDMVSKDLKRRGFTFVGSTIVYSFLQAVGVIDDHLDSCPSKGGR